MRLHLRYAGDVDGRPPSADVVGHLVEYVVRLALRERWDLADTRSNAERVRRMMFAERSELIEMAGLSGLTFTGEDAADAEVVLSVSDIGYIRRVGGSGSSLRVAESLLNETSIYSSSKSPSAGAMTLLP